MLINYVTINFLNMHLHNTLHNRHPPKSLPSIHSHLIPPERCGVHRCSIRASSIISELISTVKNPIVIKLHR